jgi:myo-inositol 2-dehydrogenase / D-chiro-inositol 1-dehydrogenase
MHSPQQSAKSSSRRQFLASSALAAGACAAAPKLWAGAPHVSGSDEIKIGLIGCGARGTGAAAQALETKGAVKLWAMADAFEDRLQTSLTNLTKGQKGRYDTPTHQGFGSQVDVPPERQFVGLDAFEKLLASGVDVVLMAQPPAFRPAHLEAAVNAGKHVFAEKPLATDAPGVRRVVKAGEEAKRLGLKIGVGLQRRHDPHYVDTIKKLQDGAIGKLLCLRAYWCGGPPAKKPFPHSGLTEMQYQVRNWYFFTWLGGDHIVEQHIHNLDVCNWLMNGHPVEAQGMGGRQVRTGKEWGQIYDHHFVEFTYADGTKAFSQCRQTPGCWDSVSEHAVGSGGTADIGRGVIQVGHDTGAAGRMPRNRQIPSVNAYQVEHDALFDAIRNNKPYNEIAAGVAATMTAILGRMATYSGKAVTWDAAYNSELALLPKEMTWDAAAPVMPGEDGFYPVAMPGVTKAL